MLDYEIYCQIRDHLGRQSLSVAQTARALGLDSRTVAKWAGVEQFRPRAAVVARVGKLDAFKGQVVRWLDAHPYSAQQIYQRLCEAGYQGGRTIVKDYVHRIRPRPQQAFLKLDFAPGEAAQVDWGEYATIAVGSTRRRLSFFVMVLCYSRRMYLEFTVSQTMEFFLQCHENAFAAFGGVAGRVMVDNLKSAVLQRLVGEAPMFNPKYLDFSRHWGFEITPCNIRAGNEYVVVKNMSRWVSNAPALPLKLTFLSRHNFRLQGAKEGHQIGLVAPMLFTSRIAFYFTCRQRPGLCFQIDLCVDIGRRQRNVSKPTSYCVDVDSGLEQQRGSRVPNDVRMHVLANQ